MSSYRAVRKQRSAGLGCLCAPRNEALHALCASSEMTLVRKLFEREPGVLVLGNDGSRAKRGYHTLRIPASVMERVHRRLCNPDIIQSRIDKRKP